MINNLLLRQNSKAQQGFTLIELMISLVLGLLISAAVIQVFITSQRVSRIQTAGSEVQDSAVFGMQSIEQQVRLSNLGNSGVPLNDVTALGGIVLTAEDDVSIASNVKDDIETGYLTRGQDMASVGSSNPRNGALTNTDINSDQLTIQYINKTERPLYDCEGNEIAVNEHVISRYFVKEGTATGTTRRNLDLNCDAGRIKSDGTIEAFTDTNKNFMNGGQTIIQNIDQFNIRLGVKIPDNSGTQVTYEYSDLTVKEYMALADPKPFITNIKIAVLTRSDANSPDATEGPFKIFGVDQTLKTQAEAPKYLRRVYTTNTLLRNARIVDIIRTQPTTS